MNKVTLQFWEFSDRYNGVCPDGCSLHLNESSLNEYIDTVYKGRVIDDVPNEYERILGRPVDALISDVMISRVKLKGVVRVHEHELGNLISMAEIIIRDDN